MNGDERYLYHINEIFQSVQGEGALAGTACTFLRFAGCNLKCHYCDTDHQRANLSLTQDEVVQTLMLATYKPTLLVLTGGEPTMQLTSGLIYALRAEGYTIAIETNGTNPVLRGVDYVSVSPKVSAKVLKKNFPLGVDELRYPIMMTDSLPDPPIKAVNHFLSPIFNGDKMDKMNLEHAYRLCLKNPMWRLSVQLHKLLKVR